MRYLVGFVLALALGVMGSAMGCGESQCAAGCIHRTRDAELWVQMSPSVWSPYEVGLVLDGVTGTFTCGSSGGPGHSMGSVPTNRTGSGESVYPECSGFGFTILGAPESVEISVTAQDGSWTGSVKESPDYTRYTVCGVLCPPSAGITIPGSVLTDCTGFEDGTQCMSGELEGICLDGACAVSADCSGLENGTPCLLEDWGTVLPGRCSGGRCMAECQVLEEGTPCLQSIGGEMGVCEDGVCSVQNQ
jgi:hypothetical protein